MDHKNACIVAGTVDPAGPRRQEPGGFTIYTLCINTIRTLSMDAVQRADSGHSGAPIGLAPVADTLWQHVLRYDPAEPNWPNRDRLVLSNGLASMRLYSLLHLVGVKDARRGGLLAVSLNDIKPFRQLGSKCPGHPEHRITVGVPTTTGPLGQGYGNSVGMAIASRWLAKHFNKPDFKLFDFYVYAPCGDGDMREGVASEAASLAVHLMLNNLCWIYDSNRITIEGHTDLAFSDHVAARFKRYGWNVEHVGDANDTGRLSEAFEQFRANHDAPNLIVVDSRIGYGAPHKQDTAAAHGGALGVEEVRLAKRHYGWPEDAQFLLPDGVHEHSDAGPGRRGRKLQANWSAGGLGDRLGPLRRVGRHHHGHAHPGFLGADQRPDEKVRVHPGKGAGGGQRADRQSVRGQGGHKVNLLKQLERDGLVTSNSSIFQKAIGESDSYAATTKDDLVKGDHSIVEIYEHLAVDDMLNPVFGETDARDGCLRPDCAANLANDAEGNGHQPPRAFRRTSGRLAEEVRAVDAGGADWIHVDVMDGRFSDAAAQEAP